MATSGTGETDTRPTESDRRTTNDRRPTDDRPSTTLVVAVRVPDGADGDLATEAERRLSRVGGVADVTVEGLRGLEPRLSATVVTVAATVEVAGGRAESELVDDLAETTGVETVVERVE